MKGRAARWLIIVAFSAALGHLVWHALLGPPPAPEYLIGGERLALGGHDPTAKQLYLRRKFFLAQRPRHAWIEAVGHDRLKLYVNGIFLSEQILDGFPVAIVADLTPYLRKGPNVIGLVARQSSIGLPPRVAVDGAYVLDDGEHSLGVGKGWRCNAFFERGAYWWFEPAFNEGHWHEPQQVLCALRGKVRRPPGVATTPGLGHWISAPDAHAPRTAFRREFAVAGRPDQAWLRVTTGESYRLAINGILLDEQEEQLGTLLPVLPPIQRSYDITPVVRSGRNVVSLLMSSAAGAPRLLADLEVKDSAGSRLSLGTDATWEARSGVSTEWLATESSADWRPCRAETGDLDIPPWQPQRQDVEIAEPISVAVRNTLCEVSVMALIALLTALACRGTARCLSALRGDGKTTTPEGLVVLALVPATVAICGGVLASYDPRVARQEIYRDLWVYAAVGSVLLQWGCLAVLACWRPSGRLPGLRRWRPLPIGPSALLVLLLMAVGFCLRLRDIESVRQWDEVENYTATRNFLATGFPSLEVHKDLPHLLIHTSEAQFVPMALAALVFDDDRYVVRFPMVCFSTLGIGLIYLVGRRMFAPAVGLTAAILYTFSPVCIGMSSFGRYFSQVQFFALLSIYFFWLTLRGSGPIQRRALWWTAGSFIVMFLSWEGAALIAPGMILAAMVERRGRLHTVLRSGPVWLALLIVGAVALLQYCHAVWQKTQFLWYGTSLSDLNLRPMWRYPGLQPWYYVLESSWTQDALLPVVGLCGAILLAVRHPWRGPLRFLLLIFLATCLSMSLTLPGLAWRYIHHMVPLMILLASVTLVVVVHRLIQLARQPGLPARWSVYARAISIVCGVAILALASGLTVQLAEIRGLRVEGYGMTVLKFPDFEGPARYVSDHLREGDVVLATDPFHVTHLVRHMGWPDFRTDFWLSSALRFPATIDDRRSIALDRRDGTCMVASLENLEDIFARHARVWAVVQPERHEVLNDRDIGVFLRQHMDVVYEDWESIVLFRGNNHRAASVRRASEKTLQKAQASYLP